MIITSDRKNFEGMIGISERFALLNRLITRDVNNNVNAPTFSLYTKDDIRDRRKFCVIDIFRQYEKV